MMVLRKMTRCRRFCLLIAGFSLFWIDTECGAQEGYRLLRDQVAVNNSEQWEVWETAADLVAHQEMFEWSG